MTLMQRCAAAMAVLLLSAALPLHAQMANVQFIHTVADPSASVVDIYVNDVKAGPLDDLTFRRTTPYLQLEAGVDLTLKIAAAGSADANDQVLRTVEVGQLTDGATYVMVVAGVLGDGFNNGGEPERSIDLTIFTIDAKVAASAPANADFKIFHGVTDIPAIDVYTDINSAPIFTNIEFGEASDYISLPAGNFILTVTEAGDKNKVLEKYFAPLETAKGFATVVFASGFNTPEDEPGDLPPTGYNMGLFAALPFGGPAVELPRETARVQLFHNSSLPEAAMVDVYLNGFKIDLLDDVAYRTATPFIDVPANLDVVITIAAASSESSTDQVLGTYELGELEVDASYIIVANGVGAEGFENPMPGTRNIELDLYSFRSELVSDVSTEMVVNLFNGCTDAPSIDMYVDDRPESPDWTNVDYGTDHGYMQIMAKEQLLMVTAAGDKETVIGNYVAPFEDLGGWSAVVFTSGFLTPENEPGVSGDQYDFALLAVLPDGQVIELEEAVFAPDPALVQVIHNAALPSAEMVDIYINGTKLDDLDNVGYRTATPYLEVPSEIDLQIVVAAASSENVDDQRIATYGIGQLPAGQSFCVVASGVDGGAWNNGGDQSRDISFQLFPTASRSTGNSAPNLDVMAFHGVTDAPAIDIYTDFDSPAPTLGNLNYGMFSDYTLAPPGDFRTYVTAAGDKSTYVGGYQFDLSQYDGMSAVLLAAGFLTREDEPGPPANTYEFTLLMALDNGQILFPTLATGVDEPAPEIEELSLRIAPNPATDMATLNLTLKTPTSLRIALTDARGAVVKHFVRDTMNPGEHAVNLNLNGIAVGAYNLVITTASGASSTRLNVVR